MRVKYRLSLRVRSATSNTRPPRLENVYRIKLTERQTEKSPETSMPLMRVIIIAKTKDVTQFIPVPIKFHIKFLMFCFFSITELYTEIIFLSIGAIIDS